MIEKMFFSFIYFPTSCCCFLMLEGIEKTFRIVINKLIFLGERKEIQVRLFL